MTSPSSSTTSPVPSGPAGAPPSPRAVEHTSRQKAGYVLAGVVALANIPSAFIPTDGGDSETNAGPPVFVLVVGVVLGLAVFGLLLASWRSGRRGPVRAAAVLLVLLALLAGPAFFVSGVQTWVRAVAGLYVLATVAALVLLFSPSPRAAR